MQAHENEHPLVKAIAGSLASMTGEAVTLPVDTTKIRLQLAGEGGAKGPRLGMLGTARGIVRAEGVRGLFKGLGPGLLRQGSYQSIKMGLYEPLREVLASVSLISDPEEGKVSLLDRIVAGGLSGAIGAGICNPTDLIKVRLQADAAGTRYKGMVDAFASTYRAEGLAGFYKGAAPNVYRAFIVNAAELATYDTVKLFFIENGYLGDHFGNHFLSSTAAGIVAAVTSTPVDLCKTRLMSQAFDPVTGKGLKYSSMLDCLIKTARAEGILGLWKGTAASALRISPWAVVMFSSFEFYRSALHSVFSSADSAGEDDGHDDDLVGVEGVKLSAMDDDWEVVDLNMSTKPVTISASLFGPTV